MKQNDFDALFEAAKSGDKKKMEKLGNAAASVLSEEQKSTIEKAMADPDYLRSVLSSPKAQEILKKLQGGDK
ncbi:MAG: hypothetical protein IKL10_11550 [Clostridia bacterium]|nr:hypothetical protein [Clostridia bacterium]